MIETSLVGKNDSADLIDLSNLDVAPETVGRKGKKRNGTAQPSPEPKESFDLTNGSIELSPPKRSRRAADNLVFDVNETVELEDVELNNNGTRRSNRNRRGRPAKANQPFTPPAPKPKKIPKPKGMTYKQALKLITAPIPPLPETPPIQIAPVRPNNPAPLAIKSPACDVDLTGDIKLGPQHSSAPLFQKYVPKNNEEEKVESDEDDMDPNIIKVSVKYKEIIKPYKHRLHQRYFDLYKLISEQEDIPLNNMYIYDIDRRIDHDDTPHTTQYRISKILLLRVMESKAGASCGYSQLVKKNHIEVKFQSDKWKKAIALKISKYEDFKTVINILCEQIPFKPDQVTLRFDGDLVELKQTPLDLDFEGGEIMDCGIKV